MKILKEIAINLADGNQKTADKGYMTSCPCCGGSTPNLQLWRSGIGDIRGKCFNGCPTKDVLTVVHELEQKLANRIAGSNDETDGRIMGITETDLIQKDIPEPRMLLYPFLTEGSITLLYAGEGCGKTWVVTGLGIALSRDSPIGIKIGPWEVKNGCGCLLIDGELPEIRIKRSIDQLAKGFGDRGKVSTKNEFRIFSTIAENSSNRIKYNLTDENFRNQISAHFDTQKTCRLLLLDNITSLTSGISVSSQISWDPINDWLKELRGRGISTIMVHHANKNGTDLGTSSRKLNIENVIRIDREGKDADRVCAKIKFEKGRDLLPGQGKSFILQLLGDDKTGLRLEQVSG